MKNDEFDMKKDEFVHCIFQKKDVAVFGRNIVIFSLRPLFYVRHIEKSHNRHLLMYL